MRNPSPERLELNRIAKLLILAWETAEPADKPVNVSYLATFVDLARAVISDRSAPARSLIIKDLQEGNLRRQEKIFKLESENSALKEMLETSDMDLNKSAQRVRELSENVDLQRSIIVDAQAEIERLQNALSDAVSHMAAFADSDVLKRLTSRMTPETRAAYPAMCKLCKDGGVIETGNNDLPCSCPAGDGAVFSTERGRETGAQIKARR